MSYVETPNISVVMSCYNYGRYLADSISSVFNQTYKDIELILVDDGSSDNSYQVAEGFKHELRFRYIYQENSGQANAKNTGLSMAKGNFIAFLDADDLWTRDKLEKQLTLFTSEYVGVVYSRAKYISEIGEEVNFKLAGKYLQPRRGNVTDFLIMDNFVPFSSSIVRRSCFEQFGNFDESLKMGIDWDLWLRISTKYTFDFIDEPLLLYRIGHSGQMSKNLEERQRCSDRILISFATRFPSNAKREVLKKAWAYTYMNRALYHREHNPILAIQFYFKAIRQWPLSIVPLLGVFKVVVKALLK
jgi:glycosyltransferase involved in cell wall biosynthesis